MADLSENMQCPICASAVVNLVYMCGHVVCSICYLRLGNNNCPVCRQESVPHRLLLNRANEPPPLQEHQQKYIKYKQKYLQLKNK